MIKIILSLILICIATVGLLDVLTHTFKKVEPKQEVAEFRWYIETPPVQLVPVQ